MQAHKIILTVIDFDQLGAAELKRVLENTKYPNHCIAPSVFSVETVELGEWEDDHPLNNITTAHDMWCELFPALKDEKA